MSNNCNHKNPLIRSGVNQYQRVLRALLPDFVRVDERDHADLILFAKNYASHLKYISKTNTEDGDWKPFMTMDLSVTLASLIKLDIPEFFTYAKDIYDKISETDLIQEADLKDYFKTLFDLGFSITRILDQYYRAIPVDFGFKEVFGSAIHSSLPEYYDRLKKYYDEAVSQNLIDPAGTFTFSDTPDDLIFSQDFNPLIISDIWLDTSIPAFSPVFNGATTSLKIKNTATHNLFTGILDQYLKVLSGVVDSASAYLDQTLDEFPTHSPHYALYLAFIKLFKFARDHQNTLTAKHLDLYYREILKIDKKEPVPDNVHLIFELAKTAGDSYLVEKDTVFKAGKDADGKEIFYALTEDAVLGKASVGSLKNVFVKRNLAQNTRQVLASPVANSEDGQGAELESTDKSWLAFGNPERLPAELGFIVASNYLYLREGTRTINFKFHTPNGSPISFNENVINNHFHVKLSGEEGWIDVPVQPAKVKIAATKEYFEIEVMIDGGEPPVVGYSPDIHGYDFTQELPMALFLLKNAQAKEILWDFEFEKVGIEVKVTGMKDVIIENDTGVLNPAKPFDLFGSSPHVGSGFLVGSKELFLKTLQPVGNVSVKLNLTWDNYSELATRVNASDNKHKVDIEYLEDAVWKNTANNEKLFATSSSSIFESAFQDFGQFGQLQQMQFQAQSPPGNQSELSSQNPSGNEFISNLQNLSGNESALDQGISLGNSFGGMESIVFSIFLQNSVINFELPPIEVDQDYSPNENFSSQSKWGFFRLKLDSPDFGHSTYAKRLSDAAKAAVITSTESNGTTTTTVQIGEVTEPYTPKVKEFSIEYSASTELGFSTSEEGKILYVLPFGHKDISGSSSPVKLLPGFENEGEFFIGIDQQITGQTLSVLFQVAEGTADPLIEKQDVQWYFLGEKNEWIQFEKSDIADGTNGLIKSGIVKFSITGEAVSTNTLMGEQLIWLKATVAEKTQAICHIIDIRPQAALAQFTDYKGESNYFKNTLPAGTISKLVFSESAVKKTDQPYASFGGKTSENDEAYYRRISERLRHKDRAIAMWDYERLVLEEFPEIYKVKCINHTQILEKQSGTDIAYVDNELKPGHVLVVPVPDLHGKNAFDPLRPYTSLGTLEDIKIYLYGKISPHVNLDVRNPKFEEIQLEFNVQFLTDDIELYIKRLKEEIEQFLAPWAYDVNSDIEFGGKISKSVLINFIEERSYVDYLSCVKMYQIVDGIKSKDLEEAFATSSRSVFVSVKSDDPLSSHIINETVCKC